MYVILSTLPCFAFLIASSEVRHALDFVVLIFYFLATPTSILLLSAMLPLAVIAGLK